MLFCAPRVVPHTDPSRGMSSVGTMNRTSLKRSKKDKFTTTTPLIISGMRRDCVILSSSLAHDGERNRSLRQCQAFSSVCWHYYTLEHRHVCNTVQDLLLLMHDCELQRILT